MGNVLKMEKQQLIKSVIRLGWSDRRISREFGINRQTVSKYRKKHRSTEQAAQIQNIPKVPTDSGAEKVQNIPKVPPDFPATNSPNIIPHISKICKKLTLGLSAQRIYQDLVEEAAFEGSYDSVKRYCRKARRKSPKHYDKLPVAPGMEAQVDFGKGGAIKKGKGYRKAWFFKMTLSFSGHAYEELVHGQDIETFIRCHENAFRHFDGVPEIVKIDNLKSGVLKASLYEPVLNATYAAFSEYCGFAVNPCPPFTPEQKGRVEKDVDYTKDNALKGRRFETIEEGNLFLKHWNKRWARTRIHGRHKKQVWKMFIENEKPNLKPYNIKPYPYFETGLRKVPSYGLIEVGRRFYSVPDKYIGQTLHVHFNKLWVKVFVKEGEDLNFIVQHRYIPKAGQCIKLAEHRPAYKSRSLIEEENYLSRRAREIGADCHAVVSKIFASQAVLGIRIARGVVYLTKKYSKAIIEEASGIALLERRYSSRFISGICSEIQSNSNRFKKEITQNGDLIRDCAEYQQIIEGGL